MFLIYGGDKELVVNGYVDASFDTDPDDSKSQTGYMFILNGGAVSWSSSKQSVVAGSTCEAKYIAALEAVNEGVWMKEFISNLGVIPSASGLMKILCVLVQLPWQRNPDFTREPSTSRDASIPSGTKSRWET